MRCAIGRGNDLVRLLPDRSLAHRAGRLLEDELIDVACAADHSLTEAPRCVEYRLAEIARDRVHRKRHPRHVAVDERLYDDGHRGAPWIEAMRVTVVRGAVLPQRRETTADRVDGCIRRPDAEVRV